MASLQQLLQQFGGGGGAGAAGGGVDLPVADTAETIQISSMALLKMLKHGRLGIPMEVMGLMLGEFVDEYTVTCVDVFAMPQHGTGVSVEAVDPVFQTKMLDMLKQTGRPEMVVGWYHSHRKSSYLVLPTPPAPFLLSNSTDPVLPATQLDSAPGSLESISILSRVLRPSTRERWLLLWTRCSP